MIHTPNHPSTHTEAERMLSAEHLRLDPENPDYGQFAYDTLTEVTAQMELPMTTDQLLDGLTDTSDMTAGNWEASRGLPPIAACEIGEGEGFWYMQGLKETDPIDGSITHMQIHIKPKHYPDNKEDKLKDRWTIRLKEQDGELVGGRVEYYVNGIDDDLTHGTEEWINVGDYDGQGVVGGASANLNHSDYAGRMRLKSRYDSDNIVVKPDPVVGVANMISGKLTDFQFWNLKGRKPRTFGEGAQRRLAELAHRRDAKAAPDAIRRAVSRIPGDRWELDSRFGKNTDS